MGDTLVCTRMNKLLEVIKRPLDSERFHQLLTKKQWFILFNVGTITTLILSGRLKWSLESVVTSAIAFLAVNFVAAISARHFPNWK
jgi:hypothetical protein